MNMFKLFIQFSRKYEKKKKIMEKNMTLWTTMTTPSGKQYEHSCLLINIQGNTEVWTIIFKYE